MNNEEMIKAGRRTGKTRMTTLANTGIDIQAEAPLGIAFDKIYVLKTNPRHRVYVQGIKMHFGIPFVWLSNDIILKASIFLRKFRLA